MQVEHVNISVADARASAAFYERVFGWHSRWEGPALGGGRTIHVGTDESYLAVYEPPRTSGDEWRQQDDRTGLNHIGVVVDDPASIAERLDAEGVETFHHMAYEPGERFYFNDPDGIEIEVVSYA